MILVGFEWRVAFLDSRYHHPQGVEERNSQGAKGNSRRGVYEEVVDVTHAYVAYVVLAE